MKLVVVSGSHRLNSQSERVSRFCMNLASQQGFEPELISLAGNPFPFWDESIWKVGVEQWSNGVFKKATQLLKEASAVIIVSPEWSGMVPPGLKNFFLLAEATLAHKPALLVGITTGLSGTWPVAELKVSSSKNTRLVYIPEHVILRHVDKLLDGANAANADDQWVRDRLRYSIEILQEYSKGLAAVRASGKIDLKTYPNGM
jgi:NAD(P)H-dependent FMN reductase